MEHMSSCSMCLTGAQGAAAFQEHREQLQWSSDYRGARTAALLEHMEQLYLLPESRCTMCSNRAAVSAPGKPLLHVLQWSCCICNQQAPAPPSTCSSRAALCAPPVHQNLECAFVRMDPVNLRAKFEVRSFTRS